MSGDLYSEELFGTIGFSGMSSLLYHVHRPTQVSRILQSQDISPKIEINNNILPLRLDSERVSDGNTDFFDSRVPLFVNATVKVSVTKSASLEMDYFYKNVSSDELIFVHHGNGTLRTFVGNIDFVPGDYLLIPRGTIYKFETKVPTKLLIVESGTPIHTPKRYRNHFGQLLEHSPYCERDYKLPSELETHDDQGEFLVKINKGNALHQVVYAYHPFSVIGWDGYNYPFGLSIHDFEPIVGRVHQPPPVHQTFEAGSFVVCSFCPRLYDWHPESIPAPYNHSNIDSDEILYYVDGDFMSRNDIAPGVLTLHPAGIPHGPHPGAVERSIGKKSTDELAVMVDTFQPLQVTSAACSLSDGNYYRSWI